MQNSKLSRMQSSKDVILRDPEVTQKQLLHSGKEIVFLNGKFIAQDKAKISVIDPGFLYSWGLFETMRSYNNKIVYFDKHLKRIKNSCSFITLKFSYSLRELKKIIKKAVKINGFRDAYLRLTLWKSEDGTNILIIVKKYNPCTLRKYKQGFHACIYPLRQNVNSFLTRLKTTNHLSYQLASLYAKKRRFEEALILNNRGYIAEGSRSNIFWVKNNALFTPRLECGCLDGITRQVIFDLAKKYNIKVYEGNFIVQDLYKADEAFLTNSLIGVMPLTSLEKKTIGLNKCGKTTQFFIKKYNCLLR